MTPVPQRKPTRLPEHDYSQPGGYFVTVCTKEKAHLFGRLVGAGHPAGPYVELSEYGNIVERRIRSLSQAYSGVFVDAYVVMPNHIHLLLRFDPESGPAGCPAPTTSLPKVISALKSLCSKDAAVPLWQRGYYEHILRNEEDFRACAEYILGNPARWAEYKAK